MVGDRHTQPGPEALRADHLRSDWTPRYAPATTPTPSRRSPAVCWAAYGVRGAVGLAVLLHGWPGMRAHDLVNLASAIARGGQPDSFDFSYLGSPIDTVAVHPHDDKCCSAASGCCAIRRTRSMRWSRYADWPTTICATTSRTSRSG